MRVEYMVRLTPEEEGGFSVGVPDLPGCFTEGETIEDALDMAREAIDGWLAVQLSRNRPVPIASEITEESAYMVRPSTQVAVPVWIRMEREARGLSQSDVAALLGISQQAYAKYEDVDNSNPRLSTLIKLQEIFEDQIIAV